MAFCKQDLWIQGEYSLIPQINSNVLQNYVLE